MVFIFALCVRRLLRPRLQIVLVARVDVSINLLVLLLALLASSGALALTLASGMREGRACASTTRRVAQHLAPSPSAAAASDCYEAPRPMRCR